MCDWRYFRFGLSPEARTVYSVASSGFRRVEVAIWSNRAQRVATGRNRRNYRKAFLPAAKRYARFLRKAGNSAVH